MPDALGLTLRAGIDVTQSTTNIKRQSEQIQQELNKTPMQLRIEMNTGVLKQQAVEVTKEYQKMFSNLMKQYDTIQNAYWKQFWGNFNQDIGIGTTNSSAKAVSSVFQPIFDEEDRALEIQKAKVKNFWDTFNQSVGIGTTNDNVASKVASAFDSIFAEEDRAIMIQKAKMQQFWSEFNQSVGIGTTSNNSAKSSASVFEQLFQSAKYGTAGLSELEKQIVKLNPQTKSTSKEIMSLSDQLALAAKKMLEWTIVGTAIFGTMRQIKQGISFLNDLNKSMTNIQMITGATNSQIQQMTKDFSDLASQLHETTSSMMGASEEFLRAGNNAQDSAKLLQASTVMSKIAGQSQQESAQGLISIMNAFHMSADDMMSVVDKMVAIDNTSATSTKELNEAIQKSAASAQAAGVSFDQLVSWIGTVSSVTRQSASSIGAGLNSIFSRFESIREGKDFDPEGQPLNNVEKALNRVGIAMRTNENTFRSFNDILNEVSANWSKYNDVQKNEIATAIAGTYQRNRFLALIQNFNTALQMQTTEANSAGNAMNRYAVYAESTEAKINDLKNAVEKLWMDALSSKTINNVIFEMTGFVQIIDRAIKGLGGWNIALMGILVTSLKFASVLKDVNNATKVTTRSQFINNIIHATTSMVGLTRATETATLATIGFNAVAMGIPLLIGGIVLGIEAWSNHQQKIKEEIEETNKSVANFNTVLEKFNSTLDTQEINDLAIALDNIKKAVSYDDTIKQIQKLKDQINEITSNAANDNMQGQISLLPKLNEQLQELENKIKPVKEAQEQYNKAVENSKQPFHVYNDMLVLNKNLLEQMASTHNKAFETTIANAKYELDTLAKATKEKLKLYGVEIEALNSVADARKASIGVEYGDAGISYRVARNYLDNLTSSWDYLDNLLNTSSMSSISSSYIPTGSSSSSSSTKNQPDTSLSSYYDSLIRTINAESQLTDTQNKSIKAQIDQAKTAKDYNTELQKTNELISGQSKEIQQLQSANSELQKEYDHQSSISGFNTSNWFDKNGEATIEFTRQYLAASKDVQDSMKQTFDTLQKLDKAMIANNQTIQTLTQSNQELSFSIKDIASNLATEVLNAEKSVEQAQLDAQEKALEAFKTTHQTIIDGLQAQLDAMRKNADAEQEEIERQQKLQDIANAQLELNNAMADTSHEYIDANGHVTYTYDKVKVEELQNKLKTTQTNYYYWERQTQEKHQEQSIQDAINYQNTLIKNQEDAYNTQKKIFDNQWKNIETMSKKLLDQYGSNIDKAVTELSAKLLSLNAQLAIYSSGVTLPSGLQGLGGSNKPTVEASGVDAAILRAQYGDSINIVEGKGLAGQPGTDRVSTNQMYQAILGKPLNNISTDKMWSFDEGGIVGNQPQNKLVELANKLFNSKLQPGQTLIQSLIGELQIPPKNIMSNFLPNMQNFANAIINRAATTPIVNHNYNLSNFEIIANNPVELFDGISRLVKAEIT